MLESKQTFSLSSRLLQRTNARGSNLGTGNEHLIKKTVTLQEGHVT